jgi:phage repressor protein C with HTH and peptisase S24 domain
MDTMADRLKLALKVRGMTPADLIQQKVLSRAGVYFLLDGTTKAEGVKAATITKLCKVLRIERDWLLTGRGQMDAIDQPQDDADWSDVRGYAQAIGLGSGPEADEYAETHKLKFRRESLAGKRLSSHRLAVMYGAGDSMLPRIKAGDAILFDQDDVRPRDGYVYVVLVPGAGGKEYQAKRCMILDDAVYFVADNPAGDHNWRKPKRMDDKQLPVQIIGRVRWIGSWEG